MNTKKFLQLFLIILSCSILIVIGFNYMLDYLRIEKLLFPRVDKTLMSQEEYGTFKEIISLIRNKQLKQINDIIKIESVDLTVETIPDKKIYTRGEEANINVKVRNEGDKNLVLFPLNFEIVSELYNYEGVTTQDVSISFEVSNAKYIKILKPQLSYTKTFKVKTSIPGKNRISLTLLSPQVVEIERGKVVVSNRLIKRFDVDFLVE